MEPLNKSSTEDLFSGSLIFIGSSQFAQLLKTRFNTGDLIEITVITSQRGLQLVNGGGELTLPDVGFRLSTVLQQIAPNCRVTLCLQVVKAYIVGSKQQLLVDELERSIDAAAAQQRLGVVVG